MKTNVGQIEVSYSARGIPAYSLELWHDGLKKHRLIRGREDAVVLRKAEIQIAEWEEKWVLAVAREKGRLDKESQKREQESNKNIASSRTEEALGEINRLGNILKQTLEVDDAINWDNLKDMSMFTDDADIADLIKHNNLSIEQLTSRGLLGGRGNSTLIESEVMDELIKVFNSVPDDAVLYLKLPMEVDIKGRKVRYVPMHKFDMADIFELKEHRAGIDLATIDREVIGSFYSGSDFVTNQIDYIRQVAKVGEELRLQGGVDQVRSEALMQLRTATMHRSAAIRASFTGKHSSANRRLIENSIPFTMQGKVLSAEGIPFGVSAVSADDAVKFMTNSAVGSMDEAARLTHEVDTINELHSKLRRMSDVFSHGTSGPELDKELAGILDGITTVKAGPIYEETKKLSDSIIQYWKTVNHITETSLKNSTVIPKSIIDNFPSLYDPLDISRPPRLLPEAKEALKKNVMKDIEFLLPPQILEKQFETICKEIADSILFLLRTNKVLSNTRDLLLPRLVSGRIDVSDLEIEVPTDTHKTSK